MNLRDALSVVVLFFTSEDVDVLPQHLIFLQVLQEFIVLSMREEKKKKIIIKQVIIIMIFLHSETQLMFTKSIQICKLV